MTKINGYLMEKAYLRSVEGYFSNINVPEAKGSFNVGTEFTCLKVLSLNLSAGLSNAIKGNCAGNNGYS